MSDTTNNFNIIKPADRSSGWGAILNEALDNIDGVLGNILDVAKTNFFTPGIYNNANITVTKSASQITITGLNLYSALFNTVGDESNLPNMNWSIYSVKYFR